MGSELIQWFLLGLPIAFALGWLASRWDGAQWRREQADSPRSYFKGLNLLLDEKQDQAIDAFIAAMQQEPASTDLHFSLGNLFRRRGEYARAVRVHEHLLARGDLPAADRLRAQHALAQDYTQAGLIDRAQSAWAQLEGSDLDRDARIALLTLHERAREWPQAIATAQALANDLGPANVATRLSHYWCEAALEAEASGDGARADQALGEALKAQPDAARPRVLMGQRRLRAGDPRGAMAIWRELLDVQPQAFALVVDDYIQAAIAGDARAQAAQVLDARLLQAPSPALLQARVHLMPEGPERRTALAGHLERQPSIAAAQGLLQELAAQNVPPDRQEAQALLAGLKRGTAPLKRYRCTTCGFESQQHFWQCPGCLSWDSFSAEGQAPL